MQNNVKGKFGLAGMIIALFVMLLGVPVQAQEVYFQLEPEKSTYAIGDLIKIKIKGSLDHIYGCELVVSYAEDKISFGNSENISLNGGVSSCNADAENGEIHYIYSLVGEKNVGDGMNVGDEWGEFIFTAVKEGKVIISVQLLKYMDVKYGLVEPENAIAVCEIEIIREPVETGTPNPGGEPVETETPNPGEEPVETETPNPGGEPVETGTPNPGGEPVETGTPNPGGEPVETGTPNPGGEPGGTERPNPSEEPGEAEPPKPTNEPVTTECPISADTASDSTDGSDGAETVKSPQTSDSFKIGMMILVCLFSVSGMTVVLIMRKNNKEK